MAAELPTTPSGLAPAPPPDGAPERRLLLVDDEPSILSALRRSLRADGYSIRTADSGKQALEILASWLPDVIVTDQRMPGMSGVSFLREALQVYPEAIRIILSGYTELESVTSAINDGAVWKFLTKPWDDARLRAVVSEAFRTKELADENLKLRGTVAKACEELEIANAKLTEAMLGQASQKDHARRQAEIYQEVFELTPLPMLAVDPDGMVVNANAAARAILSSSPLGLTLSESTGPGSGAQIASSVSIGFASAARGSLAILTPEAP